jgi:hypothetical protein
MAENCGRIDQRLHNIKKLEALCKMLMYKRDAEGGLRNADEREQIEAIAQA